MELSLELGDGAADDLVFRAELRHLLFGVEDGRMIAPERGTDLGGGVGRKFAAEVHRDHARLGDGTGALFPEDVGEGDPEVTCDGALNRLDRNVAGGALLGELAVEQLLGLFDRQLVVAAERGVARQPDERPFEAADVRGDVRREKFEEFVAERSLA